MYILVGIKDYSSLNKPDAFCLHLLKPCNYVGEENFVGDKSEWYPIEPGHYVFEGFTSIYDILNCGIEIDFDVAKDPSNVHIRLVDKNHYYLRKFT